MFKLAVKRLTIWYLAILMLLSLLFSVYVYRVSTRELDILEEKTQSMLQSEQMGQMFAPPWAGIFAQQRLEQIEEAKRNIALDLFYLNLIIFIAGWAISYLLAQKTMKPIEETHEMQKRFVADSSHELKTPLAAMKTEMEVMMRDKDATIEDYKNQIQSNLEEVARLESLSLELLALNTKPDIKLEKIDLQIQVHKVISKFVKIAELKNIKIKEDLSSALVMTSKYYLDELLGILIDNAIKYSPETSKIEILTYAKQQYCYVLIKDQGYGISEEDLPKIFDRFYRVDTSRTKENVEGHGLGLSIAQKIAKDLDVEIDVKSIVGEGTTFILRFKK